MDVSIIIINYNTIALATECIKSILQHTHGISYEIILVDNCSNDDIHRNVNENFAGCDFIKCVQLDKNVGFGRGNNAGFNVANGDFVFCLNPDTLLVNDAVSILFNFMKSNPDVGACGGNLFSIDKQPSHSFRRYLPGMEWELDLLTFQKLGKLRYGKNSEFNHTRHPLDVGFITGADLMIRSDVVKKVKGFSTDFFMYFEETDICLKIRKAGYRIVSVPEAEIIHLEGGSFSDRKGYEFNKRAVEYSERGRLLYYMRNKNAAQRFFLNAIYRIALKLNIKYFRSKNNEIWKYYEYKHMHFISALKEIRNRR